MWKWLGLILTILVIFLCTVTVLEVRNNGKRLDKVLATQEKINEDIKLISTYIERVVLTVPLKPKEDK